MARTARFHQTLELSRTLSTREKGALAAELLDHVGTPGVRDASPATLRRRAEEMRSGQVRGLSTKALAARLGDFVRSRR